MSAWVTLSPGSDAHAELPRPKNPETTTYTSGHVLSQKLLSELVSSPILNYSRMLTIMDEINLDEKYWPLIESINRLRQLHAATHSEHVIAARLGELSRLSLLYLTGCLEGLLIMDSILGDDISEGGTQRKELLDACYFLQLAPAVRSEIGDLSGCYEKTLIELLFFSICPNQHTPFDDAPQRIDSELFLHDIEMLVAARQTDPEYQHVLHQMVFR